MDADCFDALSRALTTPGSRRAAVRTLLGTLLGGALLGPSPDALATAPTANGKTTDTGRGGTKDDRHPREGDNKTDPRKDRGKARGARRAQTAVQSPRPNLAGEAARSESGEAGGDEVSAATHGCRHAGARCKRPGQCCSGKCSKARKKCLCTTASCTTTDPCKEAVCSSRFTCEVRDKTCDGGGICTPKTCAELGLACGPAGDGCGGLLQCGGCDDGIACTDDTCDGAGNCLHTANHSACPVTGQICDPDQGGCGCPANESVCGSACAPIGQPCDGSDGDLCQEGTFVCMNDAVVCMDSTGTTVEIPGNGLDEDCNPEASD